MTTEGCQAKQDTNWFAILITEFLVISVINAVTITVFARIRYLRKRSTYLIINLTVADLLLGAVAGPLHMYLHGERNRLSSWSRFFLLAFKLTFLIASPVNLSLISLERLHATLFPFKHCLLRKWFYLKIIIGSWFITLLLGSLMAALHLKPTDKAFHYAWASFCVVTLLVLTISYIRILLNVQKSPHLQNADALQTERKLSVTLFIVTGVSFLTILPWAIYKSIPSEKLPKTTSVNTCIYDILAVIYFANSIVNPFVYAIRMQEFRRALGNLVSGQRQAEQRRHQTRAERKRARRSQSQTML